MLRTIDPKTQFPISSEELQKMARTARVGDECLVAWNFDCSSSANISRGTVKERRKQKNTCKLTMEYRGIHGYKPGEKFEGHIPPHSSVRVYKVHWDKEPVIPKDATTESAQENCRPTFQHTEDDLDLEPMPTLRTVSPEFIPSVIAIYRDIVRDYAECQYPQRNRIWHRTLSAMKYSLATIRKANGRRRRRRPLDILQTDCDTKSEHSDSSQSRNLVYNGPDTVSDKRAIKKATSLVIDGCVSKATRLLDQEVTPRTLNDTQTIEKLRALHPDLPTMFLYLVASFFFFTPSNLRACWDVGRVETRTAHRQNLYM